MKKRKTLKQALQEKEEKAREQVLKREQDKELVKEVRVCFLMLFILDWTCDIIFFSIR